DSGTGSGALRLRVSCALEPKMARSAMSGLVLLLLCATCRLALGITDGLLANGNFERGPQPSQLRGTQVVGASSIPSWRTSGFVEYIPSGRKQGDMVLVVPEARGRVRRAPGQRGVHRVAPPRGRPRRALQPHLQRGEDVCTGGAPQRVRVRPVRRAGHADHVQQQRLGLLLLGLGRHRRRGRGRRPQPRRHRGPRLRAPHRLRRHQDPHPASPHQQ
uniref:DUF642 domain-containing protein n=1 Tax=Aegilops tauschii subsp. strangulata TaxID=200361 RepID=A0A453NQP6_AEGTS